MNSQQFSVQYPGKNQKESDCIMDKALPVVGAPLRTGTFSLTGLREGESFLITGGSGMTGTALRRALRKRYPGCRITLFSGGSLPLELQPDEAVIRPDDACTFSGTVEADAVFALAGEPVSGKRITRENLRRNAEGRVELMRRAAELLKSPAPFFAASAVVSEGSALLGEFRDGLEESAGNMLLGKGISPVFVRFPLILGSRGMMPVLRKFAGLRLMPFFIPEGKLPVTTAEEAAEFLASLPGMDSPEMAGMPHQMKTIRDIVRESEGNRLLLPLPAPLALLRLLNPGTAELFGKYSEKPGTIRAPG